MEAAPSVRGDEGGRRRRGKGQEGREGRSRRAGRERRRADDGRREEIRTLLDRCRVAAGAGEAGEAEDAPPPSSRPSPRSPAEALRSLRRALVARGATAEAGSGGKSPGASGSFAADDDADADAGNDSAEREFLCGVAREILGLDRVVRSVDEEIDSDFPDTGQLRDYDSDAEWYEKTAEAIDRSGRGRESGREGGGGRDEGGDGPSATFEGARADVGSGEDLEREIDRCLDACGPAPSLEAAADCLRDIVRDSPPPSASTLTSTSTISFASNGASDEVASEMGWERPGLAAAISSLRTVRRRLIPLPCQGDKGSDGWDRSTESFPESLRRLGLHVLDEADDPVLRQLWERVALPVEYHRHRQEGQRWRQEQRPRQRSQQPPSNPLSESLYDLSTSALPTLVASACHAMSIPLPAWAAPDASRGMLFRSAWQTVLAGEVWVTHWGARLADLAGSPEGAPLAQLSYDVRSAASDHFRRVARGMIEGGRPEVLVDHVHACWSSCSDGIDAEGQESPARRGLAEPRTILRDQLRSAVLSVPSKREVALFARAMLRRFAKHRVAKANLENFSSRRARERLDEMFGGSILPFLLEVLQPSLDADARLAEAMVHFVVLSPPTSFHRSVLNASDFAVPRCLSHLLALAYVGDDGADRGSKSDDDAEGGEEDANVYHAQLLEVASVWCEDVFLTRTDGLRQRYATEFVLHPLECGRISQEELQADITGDGESLAEALVRGVSLRLDVSRSESIRTDGMRVAEAMAAILGQTLRFDELHLPGEDDDDCVDKKKDGGVGMTNEKKGKKTKRKPRTKPKAPVVIDPDAEYFTDDSYCSDSSSQSESSSSCESGESSDSKSSWGEDSLQPYAMDDDEEDLRRVPRPCTLRNCLSYLLTSENDNLAYDKHHASLTELPTVVASKPSDLMDVVPTLVRVLLFMEDKFNMDQFEEKRWEALMSLGYHAPLETCALLVEEMKGNVALGTRIDALSLLSGMAQELSGMWRGSDKSVISDSAAISSCSTRLQKALNLQGDTTVNSSIQPSKTRRWRRPRNSPVTTRNDFGKVSAQMIYPLFAFLSQTRTDTCVWGGATGEKFLCEFLKTLSIMLYCGRTYPSSALRVLATDLFDLAWSFHDAKCSEVRCAALAAMAVCVSMVPVEFVISRNNGGFVSFLNSAALDQNEDCRRLASLVGGSISESLNQNL